jgi:hypothetical protein
MPKKPQKPECRANIKFENNSNDGFNYRLYVIMTVICIMSVRGKVGLKGVF